MSEETNETGPAGLVKPAEMNFVSKSWGWELWICNNKKYCGKKLFIKQGHHLSYHFHNIKDEVLYCESGKMLFTHNLNNEPETIQISKGHAFHVTPGVVHQMYAIEDTVLFEFSTQHFDEDSFRVTRDLVNANVQN